MRRCRLLLEGLLYRVGSAIERLLSATLLYGPLLAACCLSGLAKVVVTAQVDVISRSHGGVTRTSSSPTWAGLDTSRGAIFRLGDGRKKRPTLRPQPNLVIHGGRDDPKPRGRSQRRPSLSPAGNGVLKSEFEFGGDLQHLFLRYTQALITQMAQIAVCNRHHSIEQQLCRWLLLSADRLPNNVLTMTQDLIANMLGVRREGVTASAGKLQDAGVIRYSRGRITIVDRPKLEKRVCECYAVVNREFDRLLPIASNLNEGKLVL